MPDRGRRDRRPRAARARGGGGARRTRSAVTFAGSPDRVEARLVPEAGYELDTFRVSGLPRRPGPRAAASAPASPVVRPSRAAASSRRREPHVVLGAGGYVGAPMVVAARRTPHPGRADRGRRAPRAREPAGGAVREPGLPRLRPPGPRPPKYRVTGRPIPSQLAPVGASGGARAVRPARRGAGARHLRRARRGALAERARARGVRRGRPGRPARVRRARLRAPASTRSPRRLSPDPLRARVRRRARRDRPRGLARGRDRVGAGGRRRSRACSCPTPSRPPTISARTRSTSRGEAAPSSCRRPSSASVPEVARSLLGDERRLAQMRAGDAAPGAPGRGRRDRRGADRAWPRSPVGSSGSPASAARACRPMLFSRARGERRWRAGTATRRPTSRTCGRPGSRSRSPTSRRAARGLRGDRLDGVRGPRAGPRPGPSSSPSSSSLRDSDRRRRRAREDDDDRDDRVRARTSSGSTPRS